MAGFYRRFVKDYAKVAKPLTVLLRVEVGQVPKSQSKKKKKIITNLNDETIEAFNKIKRILTISKKSFS